MCTCTVRILNACGTYRKVCTKRNFGRNAAGSLNPIRFFLKRKAPTNLTCLLRSKTNSTHLGINADGDLMTPDHELRRNNLWLKRKREKELGHEMTKCTLGCKNMLFIAYLFVSARAIGSSSVLAAVSALLLLAVTIAVAAAFGGGGGGGGGGGRGVLQLAKF